MNEELENFNIETETEKKNQLLQVTTFSKYLALALFVALPFIGGWIGYQYAPVKIVEMEKLVVINKVVETKADIIEDERNLYLSTSGFLFNLGESESVSKNIGTGFSQYFVRELNSDNVVQIYHEYLENHCHESLCDEQALETVESTSGKWDYLGQTTYCDAGFCNIQHTYRIKNDNGTYYVQANNRERAEQIIKNINFVK